MNAGILSGESFDQSLRSQWFDPDCFLVQNEVNFNVLIFIIHWLIYFYHFYSKARMWISSQKLPMVATIYIMNN